LPDKHQIKSKYTSDRQIPGAFEGETVTRRRFMTGTTHVAGAVAASAFLLPALGFALGPVFEQHKEPWQDIGSIDEFTGDTYTPKTIQVSDGIGEAGRGTAYVRKYNPQVDSQPLDEYNHLIAISSSCMHLGCPVQYVPAAERFICPCHGGVYNVEGKVAGGPPVRPLDRYYTRIRGNRVQLGPKYSVNSNLQKFSPRDPGEPLDGIGQYLYPSRPTLRKDPNQ
jgi:menaquinol-cytochrome c reductase iron-sulfur subunit